MGALSAPTQPTETSQPTTRPGGRGKLRPVHNYATLAFSGWDGDWWTTEVNSVGSPGTIHYPAYNLETGETRCTCRGQAAPCWHRQQVERAYRVYVKALMLRGLDDHALSCVERELAPQIGPDAPTDTLILWDAIGDEWSRRARGVLRRTANVALFG